MLLTRNVLAPPILFPVATVAVDSYSNYKTYIASYWRLDTNSTTGVRIDSKGSVNLTNPPGFIISYATNTIVTNAILFLGGNWTAGIFNGKENNGTNDGPASLNMTNSSYTLMTWFWVLNDGMGAAPPYGVFGKWDDDGPATPEYCRDYCITVDAANTVSIRHSANDGFDSPTEYFVSSTNTVTDNAWNFIVGVYDKDAQKLYISLNGSPLYDGGSANVPVNWTSHAPLALGFLDGITWLYPNDCKEDETAIFKGYAFTSADVTFWYNSGNGRDPTVPCGLTR